MALLFELSNPVLTDVGENYQLAYTCTIRDARSEVVLEDQVSGAVNADSENWESGVRTQIASAINTLMDAAELKVSMTARTDRMAESITGAVESLRGAE